MTRRRRRQRRPTAADHRGHYRGDPRPPSPFCQSHLLGFLVARQNAPSPRRDAGSPGPGKSAAVQSPCRRGDGRVEAVALPLWGTVAPDRFTANLRP